MTDHTEPGNAPERPSWAGATSTSGFTPPRSTPSRTSGTSQSEHRPPKSPRKTESPQEKPRKKPGRLGTIFLSMVVVVLVVAAGVMVWKAFNPESVSAPLPASEFETPAEGETVGPTGEEPVELVSGGPMTSAAMGPNTLYIPALGVYMPVESDSTFVSSHYADFQSLKIPSDPTRGVRFAGGAPLYGGNQGTTMIAGHVSTSTAWGALRYLYTLTGGEMIYTKDADGQLQSWKMTQMRVENQTDFPQDYWSPEGDRRLVLTTCGGKVGSNHLFTQNIFVVAVPVDPKPKTPEEIAADAQAAEVAAQAAAAAAVPAAVPAAESVSQP